MTFTKIKAKLQPTEDPEKVAQAIKNIFGNIELKSNTNDDLHEAEIHGVNHLFAFKKRIAQDRIRSTLYSVFTRWSNVDTLSFGLNRQAAYAGHVSLNLENEDPMGPIQVEISGNIKEVINFLCEKKSKAV